MPINLVTSQPISLNDPAHIGMQRIYVDDRLIGHGENRLESIAESALNERRRRAVKMRETTYAIPA